MSNGPEQNDFMKQLLGGALSDNEAAFEGYVQSFDRVCIAFVTRYILEGLPKEESEEVKSVLFTQWLESAKSIKSSNKIAESIFGEIFGNAGIEKREDTSLTRATEYVKGVLGMPNTDDGGVKNE